ncbi:hypothetical protein RRF57_003005 [Xylaria bambusicola]|uniref:Uncharacterized protein n=1 Tax=Xylaria bambusicola TaxID=326684 RepID=A0AAN7YW32_9PEZI
MSRRTDLRENETAIGNSFLGVNTINIQCYRPRERLPQTLFVKAVIAKIEGREGKFTQNPPVRFVPRLGSPSFAKLWLAMRTGRVLSSVMGQKPRGEMLSGRNRINPGTLGARSQYRGSAAQLAGPRGKGVARIFPAIRVSLHYLILRRYE